MIGPIIIDPRLDPRWHEVNHAPGLSGEDAGLNRFRPITSTCLAARWLPVPGKTGSGSSPPGAPMLKEGQGSPPWC